VTEASKKEKEKMQSLKAKHFFGKNTSPFYFDPVTGLKR
jgi:hypothetical protein